MHAVANVHRTIQVGRGLALTQGGARDLVGRFVHVLIIGAVRGNARDCVPLGRSSIGG